MTLELKKTADGSFTLYVPDLDEHYHSYHGALQEAKHVFIQNGVLMLTSKKIRILEVGFGTGLNALLTACESVVLEVEIEYVGVEAYPVPIELLQKMDYASLIDHKNAFKFYNHMIQDVWGEEQLIHQSFKLTKVKQKIENYECQETFDIIYFDAFGPRVQEEMWTIAIMEKMYNSLNISGFLVTYCAKGQFKRDLKTVGFQVFDLPGPPGKREMVRAVKN
jgi:tRNA U34 5-methylaminomethyl-2-thiouridine-forming methyltransferase MnmC